MQKDASAIPDVTMISGDFALLIESAARLQELVPDMVLVGGTAAAIHVRHRVSMDHDHVLSDLEARYAAVLDAVEASAGWVTSIRGTPPKTILGMEAGFEAGIRQLRRKVPLEVVELVLPSSRKLVIPSAEEMLRIKAYLIVNRNQVRDYLDVAALSKHLGIAKSVSVLAEIDSYYAELTGNDEAVCTVLTTRLQHMNPKDRKVIRNLSSYRGLDPLWANWANVEDVCRSVALGLVEWPYESMKEENGQ